MGLDIQSIDTVSAREREKAYAARERRLARMAVERRSVSDEDMDRLLDMLALQDA